MLSVNTIFLLARKPAMNDALTMTYSAIVTGKDQKKIVRVKFERPATGAVKGSKDTVDFAEGLLPDCRIVSKEGFTQEEIEQLEMYMKANLEEIMSKAKIISNPLKWL